MTRFRPALVLVLRLPLALGVVCGEFLIGTFREVFALAIGLQPYRIWMF